MKADANLATSTLRRKIKEIQTDIRSTADMIRDWTPEEKARFHNSQAAKARKVDRLQEILRMRGEKI